ncbi:MAG TPA: hypothetical protein DD723_03315 [Candidatus Omnitrophica bacterium]|nr:MAG: hypothetical protein A2Z81_00960 [Omnitrophica WOR_2 bacterium GWA2_45_18]HBR14559.1 hypothetical protein [Candidatus Omnitrophota bacterium]
MPPTQIKHSFPSFAAWYAGKSALVTGATSGIGREMARLLIRYGARVVFCGREETALKSLDEELKTQSTIPPEGFCVDLSQPDSLKSFIHKIRQKYTIDILVNNAGLGYMGDFCNMPEKMLLSLQDVNMAAVVRLCHAFSSDMKERPGTGILNVGSVASFFPTPGSALYGATKHFILGFTDALHQEMAPFQVHVSGVYPGKTASRFLERATEGRLKVWEKSSRPEDVARLGLQGLMKNKIRTIPGLDNQIKVLMASVLPVSFTLRKMAARHPRQ